MTTKPRSKAKPPPRKSRVLPPTQKTGRPRKPRPPRNDHQAGLAAAIEDAETRRDAAAVVYAMSSTVAAEVAMLHAEMAVALAWSAFCRAQGTHSPALKYGELATKLAARLVALREIAAADKLEELLKRANREDAASGVTDEKQPTR